MTGFEWEQPWNSTRRNPHRFLFFLETLPRKNTQELEADYWLKPTLNYEQMLCIPVFNSFNIKGHRSRKVSPKRYPALSSIFTPNTELWGSWTLANTKSQKGLFPYQLQREHKWGWAKDVRYQMVSESNNSEWVKLSTQAAKTRRIPREILNKPGRIFQCISAQERKSLQWRKTENLNSHCEGE